MNDQPSPRKTKPRRSDDIYGIIIPSKRRGQPRGAKAIYPKELTRYEVAAIGVITIQWAYLEHMLLLSTAELVNKGAIPMPFEATQISFRRRLDAWRTLIKTVVQDDWQPEKLLSLATKIGNVEKERHKITHWLWQWYPSQPIKLRAYSFRPPHEFCDNFDLNRLARLADRIGEINYELTHPPRRGLKKLQPDDMNQSYMSRAFLLRTTGADTVALGLDPPPPLKFNLPQPD
jgi:hypothetical protein